MVASVLLPPTWVLALLISLSASAFTVIGFVFQSLALRDPEEWKRYRRFGDIVLSPRWVLGFALQAFPNFFGDVVAYALAPLSLLAPLSGVAVALNTSLAPWMLGEKFHRYPDLPATGLILLGVICTSSTGCHKDHVEVRGLDTLVELIRNPFTTLALAALLVSLFGALAAEGLWRARIEEVAQRDFDCPRFQFVLLAAWQTAAAGCITNIGIKVFSEVLVAGPEQQLLAIAVFLIGIFPAAFGQQQSLNKGLRLYPQTVFFPIYSSLLMLANTFFGAIFFNEYVELLEGVRGSIFAAGLGAIVLGIFLFSQRGSSGKIADDMDKSSLKERLLNTDRFVGHEGAEGGA